MDRKPKESAIPDAAPEIRLMALEFLLADILAKVHRTSVDPIKSIELKRQKMRWFLEENKSDLSDSVSDRFYPEELQVAVDQLFAMAKALASRRDSD